jgi:hypothetical protein
MEQDMTVHKPTLEAVREAWFAGRVFAGPSEKFDAEREWEEFAAGFEANRRYVETMDALKAVADDETETPERRKKAREAWLREAVRGGHVEAVRPIIGRNRVAEERTERAYEGQAD